PDIGEGVEAGRRLDTTNAGRDPALRQDLEHADLAEGAGVRPTAELDGVLRHREDADDVAVLLLEDRHRATLARLGLREDLGLDGRVGEDLPVHHVLDLLDLLRGERPAGGVVEAEPIRADERALLLRAFPK